MSIKGKVSQSELQDHYATHQVYCLMSQCESFGIPAVEAQAYGTPVVGSTSCAMPEIGGDGGVYTDPLNIKGTAGLLEKCLTNREYWANLSARALINVERYHWSECTKPLIACLLR